MEEDNIASTSTAKPRRKEARTSSDRGTAVTLLAHAESSFASVSIASTDHAIEVDLQGQEGEVGATSKAEAAPMQESGVDAQPTTNELLIRAQELYKDDRLLAAHRILAPISQSNPGLLTSHHHRILREAGLCSDLVTKVPPHYPPTDGGGSGSGSGSGWHEHHEMHNNRRFIVRHKFEAGPSGGAGTTLNARIDCAIEPTLLLPLLSVLNETDLYRTWLPDWDVPIRLRVRRSVKLRQTGRCSQVLLLTMDLPWPLAPREAVLRAVACDDIDDTGTIVIRLDSLDTGDEDGLVQDPEDKGAVRVDFAGGFVFRKCPHDHPAVMVRKRKRKDKKVLHLPTAVKDHFSNHHHHNQNARVVDSPESRDTATTGGDDEAVKDMILVSFSMHSDPRAASLPQSLTSFVVRTAIGTMWSKFIKVAEDIRDDKRPRHKRAIESKRGLLYDWVEKRVKCMLALLGHAAHSIGGGSRKVGVGDPS